LRASLDLQSSDNAKAQALLQQKRETNLARQSIAGLRMYGLNYDVTELSLIFRAAYQYAGRRTDPQAQTPEIQQKLTILGAALNFNVRKLAANLGLEIKRIKTFGNV